jgi:hypothetical protein
MALPLSAKKNIKDYESKKNDNLAKIKQIFNTEFSFECDMETMYEAAPESFKNDLGKVIYDQYLGGLAENLSAKMADEMSREAFLEAVTSRKISFKLDNLDWGQYIKSVIIDGVYYLVASKKDFPCNFKQAGADIEKIL